MLTNSDCTIYHRIEEGFEKQYISECWWFEDTKSSITTEGLKTADTVTARIPNMDIFVDKGDIIVKGNCEIKAETLRDLEAVRYFKVISANYNMFSDNPHIKVVGV